MTTLQIKLLSDWRIGSGTGRPGDIDHLIRRDRDHLPFLPTKTITGVWRDGCELVAAALDQDRDSDSPCWQTWVDYLFGSQPNQEQRPEQSPIPAHLSVQSAHFPDAFRTAIAHKPLLLEALTFTKPGIKIDAHSGSAADQCFRLEEMARGNVTLTAKYRLREGLDADQAKLANALLAAGAALVERIGNKRRRGAGRCELSLSNFSLGEAHQYLENHLAPLPLPKLAAEAAAITQQSTAPVTQAKAKSEPWQTLVLTLQAKQPLVISKATVGNVVQTLDYIPGSYLLPIVLRQLNQAGLSRSVVGQAIADNQLVITPAYRCEPNTSAPKTSAPKTSNQPSAFLRGLPTPFALFKEKLDANKIPYNRFYSTPGTVQLKQCRGGYITEQLSQVANSATATESLQSTWLLKTISTGIETHNTVNDQLQRPNSDVGGVYSYQAIPAGTVLQAELRLSPELWRHIEDPNLLLLTHADRSLGRSRKDEYGSVKLSMEIATTDPASPPPTGSSEANASGPIKEQITVERITVWCISDILLRDAWLRPTTDIQVFAQRLQDALGLDQPLQLAPFDIQTDARNLFARHSRIDSWQTRWGLARPSLVGIQAGSCFVFERSNGGDIELDPARLEAVEQQGIGERCVEGFGQVKLNAALLQAPQPKVQQTKVQQTKDTSSKGAANRDPRSSSSSLNPGSIPSDLKAYAEIVETEAWRSAIRRVSLAIAADANQRKALLGFDFDETGRSQPSLTQLGGLRSQLMQLQHQSPGNNDAERWLDALKKAGKWTVGNTNIAAKVRVYLNPKQADKPDIWETLNLSASLGLEPAQFSQQLTLLNGNGDKHREDQLKEKLWSEAVETFLSACIRAHKREAEAKQDAAQPDTAQPDTAREVQHHG